MSTSDAGNVAARRVSSYMFARRGTALGICLKTALGGKDCVQKLATIIDDQEVAAAPETAAGGIAARARMACWVRGHLGPAAVTRKGSP